MDAADGFGTARLDEDDVDVDAADKRDEFGSTIVGNDNDSVDGKDENESNEEQEEYEEDETSCSSTSSTAA